MIYIPRTEYEELIAIKEIYDRATEPTGEHGTERDNDKPTGITGTDGSDGGDDAAPAEKPQSKDAT